MVYLTWVKVKGAISKTYKTYISMFTFTFNQSISYLVEATYLMLNVSDLRMIISYGFTLHTNIIMQILYFLLKIKS